MKKLKILFVLFSFILFIPLTGNTQDLEWDCGCSYDDGDGGHWTVWFNCDGSGDGLVQHFEESYDEYPSEFHIVPGDTLTDNC